MANLAYRYKATVTRVIDGDTVVVDIELDSLARPQETEGWVDMGFRVQVDSLTRVRLISERLRLAGINTPELGTIRGNKAKEYLRSLLEGKEVLLLTQRNTAGQDKQEKYGRYLAVIFLEGENINNKLIREGYARPYMI